MGVSVGIGVGVLTAVIPGCEANTCPERAGAARWLILRPKASSPAGMPENQMPTPARASSTAAIRINCRRAVRRGRRGARIIWRSVRRTPGREVVIRSFICVTCSGLAPRKIARNAWVSLPTLEGSSCSCRLGRLGKPVCKGGACLFRRKRMRYLVLSLVDNSRCSLSVRSNRGQYAIDTRHIPV